MYVPTKLIGKRYYVATRKTQALASWPTLEEALECMRRYRDLAPYEFQTIKGVVCVTPNGRQWVEHPEITTLLGQNE